MATHYAWKPLSDLPEDAGSLTDGELDPLHLVWKEQRQGLSASGALDSFNTKLQREWAIETGIIERVYDLDRGTTHTLIERGIDALLIPHETNGKSPELVARIIQDHADTLEGVFAFVKGERNLSVGYIRELHAALLANQDTFTVVDQFGHAFEKEMHRGQYKTHSNNPTRPDGTVHEYSPPEHVASEMERMVALHKAHVNRGVPVEVESAWLHHVFTQIHPFEDGNGRVARAIATLVFIKTGWFPLLITRDTREKYIDALEVADQGDLRKLVSLFVRSQRTSLLGAMEAIVEVKPPSTPDEAIAAARDLLVHRGKATPRAWQTAKEISNQLGNIGMGRVNQICDKLKVEISKPGPEFEFFVRGGQGNPNDIPTQVFKAAKSLGYSANLDEINKWTRLSFNADETSSLLLTFHGVGVKYRGLIGALVIFLEQGKEAVLASDEAFQINYEEDQGQAQARFSKWLDSALARGITLWRGTL